MAHLREIHKKELNFLLNLKAVFGKLNNRIHDVLAALAIEVLKTKNFSSVKFKYTNAGVAGTDIEGHKNGKRVLVAEVKTTTPGELGNLRGPQDRAIKKDLDRLQKVKVKHKFLILLDDKIKKIVDRKYGKLYPDIDILNVLEK